MLKNLSLYALGDIFPKAIGLFLLPIYTRYLSPEDYGLVQSMAVLSWFLIILFTFSFDRSLSRLYFDCKTEKDKKDLLGTIFYFIFIISTFLLCLLFVLQTWMDLIFTSIDFYPYFVYTIFTSYFLGFQASISMYLQVKKKAGLFIILAIVNTLLNAGLGILFVIVLNGSAEGMLKAGMLAPLIMLPFYLLYSIRISSITIRRDYLKSICLFSLPLIPTLIGAWVLSLSNRLFIERYLSLADVGIYSMAATIASLYLIFSDSIRKAYFPIYFELASSANQKLAKEKLKNYNNLLILISFIFIFLICLFSREAVIFLLDPRFHESYKLIPFLGLAYAAAVIHTTVNLSILQEKKTSLTSSIYIASSVIHIIANICLIPTFGIYGAAYALLITNTFYSITGYYISKKYYFVSYKWGQIGLFFVSFSGLIILFIFLSDINFLWTFYAKVLLIITMSVLLLKILKTNYGTVGELLGKS
tara:strand:- start:1329 stop:2750 length:1422 start_codon:yes stop_codon:yes gene_type:complete